MSSKYCPGCKQTKSVNEFSPCPSRPGGLRGECKKCAVTRVMKYHKTPKGQRSYRNAKKKWVYGITLDNYERMLKKQKGVCAICGKPETATNSKSGKVWSLCVDHDHVTGQVRQLLCHRCNWSMGLIYDDIKLLKKMIVYLERHKG